jgi:MtN3 and saliva related transmembrane protein
MQNATPLVGDVNRSDNERIILYMSIALHDLVGYSAAILTTVAFVPQALKSWQTRDLSGVSLPMYGLFTLGVALWLAYGAMLGSWPIIVANTITLALSGAVLALKIIHK